MTNRSEIEMRIVRAAREAFYAGARARRQSIHGELGASCKSASDACLAQWPLAVCETLDRHEPTVETACSAIPDVAEVQWNVQDWPWHKRNDIPPGWEPFAYDRGSIICKRRKL